MGKKKSKISKKKQAKQAKASASVAKNKKRTAKSQAFGVSVLKGSRGRSGGGSIVDGGISLGSSQKAGVRFGKKMYGDGKKETEKRGGQRKPLEQQYVAVLDEQQEFNREFAAMQERSEAAAAAASRLGGGKKRRSRAKGTPAAQNQLFQSLSEHNSLKLGPQTVGEMVEDAADRVARGMSDIGQVMSPIATRAPSVPPNTPLPGYGNPLQQPTHQKHNAQVSNANLLQTLASKKKREWAAQKYMLQEITDAKKVDGNRFAAFDNDDDSNDDGGCGMDGNHSGIRPRADPSFQFAPASFSFEGAPCAPSSARDDPDL